MDLNVFMMCEKLDSRALSELPNEFHIRSCREGELEIWKRMPFDTETFTPERDKFMTDFFNTVYGNQAREFFERCLFVCGKDDAPIGTCFAWKAYNRITTLHWFKVLARYEGRGIGRALLSTVMRNIKEHEYPVFLHTHPSCCRAIKLYSDFGFKIIIDPLGGNRVNNSAESLSILKKAMPEQYFAALKTTNAPTDFLEIVRSAAINEF